MGVECWVFGVGCCLLEQVDAYKRELRVAFWVWDECNGIASDGVWSLVLGCSLLVAITPSRHSWRLLGVVVSVSRAISPWGQ